MNKTNNGFVGVTVCLLLSAVLAGCGDDESASAPTAESLGGFNFDCGGDQQQQSKQVPFQQQQGCPAQTSTGQQKQEFTFQDSKVADFDVTLDCDSNMVVVETKGADPERRTLPISSDGNVHGTVRFLNSVSDDGKGTGTCWVGYAVTFDGKATCDDSTPSASPTPGPTPTGKTLSLTTEVDFEQTTIAELEAAGIPVDQQGSPAPTPTSTSSPSPEPVVTILPTPVPTGTGTPSPMPTTTSTASPSPTESPGQTPSPAPTGTVTPIPTVTPVKVCVVEDPCPIEAKTDVSCQ